jgi:hypothetical protein
MPPLFHQCSVLYRRSQSASDCQQGTHRNDPDVPPSGPKRRLDVRPRSGCSPCELLRSHEYSRKRGSVTAAKKLTSGRRPLRAFDRCYSCILARQETRRHLLLPLALRRAPAGTFAALRTTRERTALSFRQHRGLSTWALRPLRQRRTQRNRAPPRGARP